MFSSSEANTSSTPPTPDILTRLRRAAETAGNETMARMLTEAADEIQALRIVYQAMNRLMEKQA